MTRFCPICGTHNEELALSCQCGRVFTEDIKTSQLDPWVVSRSYRRKRTMKKAGALIGSITIILLFAAYFGGVFPMRGKSDIDDEPIQAVAEAPPIVAQPVAPNPVIAEGNVPYKVFPESNIPYKATRAITGSVIAVTDADGKERRVTLFGIRVPKLNESFGVESKENLWTLIANKPLLIKRLKFTKEVDTIAEILIDGSNVGLEHLRSGLALLQAEEVAGLPVNVQQQYLAAAQSAKNGKYGMWSGKTQAANRSATLVNQTAGSNDPLPAEIKRPGQRKQTAGRFDFPEYIYESAQTVVPLVSEPVKPKQQAPDADVSAAKEPAQIEPSKGIASPPATGRKYLRGPFGGCFYINSNGNKSYVDRSKCE